MTSYAAFLGHQPKVSVAELSATIPDFQLTKILGKNVALFDSGMDIGQKNLEGLGGTVLIARQILKEGAELSDLPQILSNETQAVKGKVTFALRAFGMSPKRLQGLYRECKQFLVKRGRPARYVGNERKAAATALLRDAGLITGKEGCELVILAEENLLWIGRTVAAQDPDEYTQRDMEKPVRDTRVGLLPPKLAQILLNLGHWAVVQTKGEAPKHLTVFDPFCGTGVIPMEALLKGWNVLASDLSAKAVTGTEKNLEWIRKQKEIKKSEVPSAVSKRDARKPFDFSDVRDATLKRGPDVIVTETMLGPALTERPTAKDAQKARSECDALEMAFLKNVAATLPGVPVVATFPAWFPKTGMLPLERVWKSLDEIGFTPMLPPETEPESTQHFSIVYRRPDQFVGREIVILKPNGRA